MAHPTEAACLLESGALYGKRLLLRGAGGDGDGDGDPIFAGFKPGAFSLYFGDAPIFHFDREGRWQRAYVDGRHYLKGFDTSIQTIDRVREGENLVLKRKTLAPAEAARFDERVRSAALDLIAALDSGRLEPVAPPPMARPVSPEELRGFLGRVAAWDADAWRAHRGAYLGTYGTLPLLPPDCPSPVVVQATLGREGGLNFGGAPAASFSARTPDQFDEHVRAVADLLGRRLEQCKSVFLGGPDVLGRPVGDVTAYLETISRVLPIDTTPGPRHPSVAEDAPIRLNGVHTFLDRFENPPHDRDALRALRALGLVRVSLGVESGDPGVRARYGKSWANEDLGAAVSDLKAAGIGVGVMTLVGAGDGVNEGRDLDATAALISSLDLGPGDLVSLIDAEDLAGPDAHAPAAPARAERLDALKTLLAPVRSGRKVKVVPYGPEKQGVS